MSNYVPCGRTIGHGETCQPDYLCGHCVRIEELEEQLAERTKLVQRWYNDFHANKDYSLWDDTEALLEGESDG